MLTFRRPYRTCLIWNPHRSGCIAGWHGVWSYLTDPPSIMGTDCDFCGFERGHSRFVALCSDSKIFPAPGHHGSELTQGDLNNRTNNWSEGLEAFVEHPIIGCRQLTCIVL